MIRRTLIGGRAQRIGTTVARRGAGSVRAEVYAWHSHTCAVETAGDCDCGATDLLEELDPRAREYLLGALKELPRAEDPS